MANMAADTRAALALPGIPLLAIDFTSGLLAGFWMRLSSSEALLSLLLSVLHFSRSGSPHAKNAHGISFLNKKVYFVAFVFVHGYSTPLKINCQEFIL